MSDVFYRLDNARRANQPRVNDRIIDGNATLANWPTQYECRVVYRPT